MSLATRITALAQAIAADVKAIYAGKVDKLADHSLVSNAERVKVANAAQRSELGTAAAANLTTSPTDSTAGRALKVGDFGIGAAPVVLNTVNLSTARLKNGFYYANNCTGTPYPNFYGFLLVESLADGQYEKRTITEVGSSRTWVQVVVGNTALAWESVQFVSKLVGLLAEHAWCQIDRTSAGDVYRYADGRMRIETPWVTGYVPGKVRSELPVVFAPGFYPAVNTTVIFVDGVTTSAQSWGQDNFLDTYFNATSTTNIWKTTAEGRWKA